LQEAKAYVKLRNERNKDFHKLYDAEAKFKHAYVLYQDSEISLKDLENSVQHSIKELDFK